MTVNSVISELRILLKEFNRTTNFSDEFLWELFIDTRAKLIEQKLKKFQPINDSAYLSFCLDLQTVNANECSELECKVKRSVFKLPAAITGRNVSSLKVFNLAGKQISPVDTSDVDKLKYNDIKKNNPAYSIENNFIYIWNNLQIKHIKVKALWEDPTDFADIQSNNQCVDVFAMDIQMERAMKDDAIKMVLELIMNTSLKIKDDAINDSNSEIR
jgi:hypothetical protein